MHVLQVAWEHPPRLFGGLGSHVEGLVAGLDAAGVDVTVLTPEHEGPETAPAGVRVLRAAPPFADLGPDGWLAEVIDAGVRMAERALQAGVVVDLVHVHDWMAGHAARVLVPALGVGVVATIHATERGRHMGHLPPGCSGWIDAQEQALVALADRVVVCSRDMAAHVIAHLGADPARTTVVPNGVDVARWRDPVAGPVPRSGSTSRLREEGPDRALLHVPHLDAGGPAGGAGRSGGASGAAGGLPRVVYAGRLEHEKGVQVLLEATRGLACEVVVAGQGSMGAQLRRTAHARTTFEGHLPQPRLAALLRSAAVAVVPSLYEPFGLAALEAMAAGVPVVASHVGGLAEVVTPDAGLRVPPGDAPALARAIGRLLDDPATAAALVRGGSARAATLTWDAAAAATMKVYGAASNTPRS